MIMANTDNTQTKITIDNSRPADSFVTSAKSSGVTSLTNKSKSIESKVMQTETPLMRYFDLSTEADHSYVLGYN